jgi:hypothetical protein
MFYHSGVELKRDNGELFLPETVEGQHIDHTGSKGLTT